VQDPTQGLEETERERGVRKEEKYGKRKKS
jgi:hypothetical protein